MPGRRVQVPGGSQGSRAQALTQLSPKYPEHRTGLGKQHGTVMGDKDGREGQSLGLTVIRSVSDKGG